jgi:hypothetical protein
LKKFFLSSLVLVSFALILISWGGTGHSKISEAAALSFNQQMKDFQSWVSFLKTHASDADYRKSDDYTEGPKHYIDIDSYSDFISKGRIPQTLDSVNQKYGSAFVIDNGILPWATIASFDSLRECMKRRNFDKAKFFAADLGHYVADGHMPLHITQNYNGQLTNQTGLHSRYETTMINNKILEIVYSGTDATEISNVNQYIFNYLYFNNKYCDSLLLADTYAKSVSGGSYNTTYTNALWTKTSGFTIPLFQRASHALASLIYTAWLQAGSPSLITTGTGEPEAASNGILEQNTPNPFSSLTHIRYTLTETSQVVMQVQDIEGNVVANLVKDILPKGQHSCEWVPGNVAPGIYYLVMKTGNSVQTKKMVYSGIK